MLFQVKYPSASKKQHKKRVKSLVLPKSFQEASIKKKDNGNYKVFFSKNTILPKNFLVFIKRRNRKFLKKKKIKFFFKININYMISSKNKNSRMGKGVGTLNRFSFHKKSNKTFIEVFNINKSRLSLMLDDIHKRHNIKCLIYKM